MRQRTAFVLVTAATCLGVARDAPASVSVALSLDDLARDATVIAKVTPVARASAWQGSRIVTTTRLRIDGAVAGSPPAREVEVRTLGGIVGGIGQIAEGEPSFLVGEPSLVFLASRGSWMTVVGRAQGQLLLTKKGGVDVVRVRNVGALVRRRAAGPLLPPGKPVTELDGAPADAVARDAARAWEATHAR
ncbi:MAG: hypothetical protein KF819_02070 [Labilithrix sp.]|nr:hypothetical protein [Labilithrix sp.]